MPAKKIPAKQYSLMPVSIAILGLILAILAFANLSGHAQAVLKLNQMIVDELPTAGSLPVDAQIEELTRLRDLQELALAAAPAEPFAWARLSYLRLATSGDKDAAFDALRMSDLVSPEQPRQLAERAMMWRSLASAESLDEKAYQAVLWQRAFQLQPQQTLAFAKKNGIVDEVGAAIQKGDSDEYEIWKMRAAGN